MLGVDVCDIEKDCVSVLEWSRVLVAPLADGEDEREGEGVRVMDLVLVAATGCVYPRSSDAKQQIHRICPVTIVGQFAAPRR